MTLSKQEKIEMAMENVEMLIIKLVNDHGRDPIFWEHIIQQTRLYKNILNPKTNLWGEGVMYIYGEFIKEIKENGVRF